MTEKKLCVIILLLTEKKQERGIDMSIKEDVLSLLLQHNISMDELANQMGINTNILEYKLDNVGSMRISEINDLITILHIQDPINFFVF